MIGLARLVERAQILHKAGWAGCIDRHHGQSECSGSVAPASGCRWHSNGAERSPRKLGAVARLERQAVTADPNPAGITYSGNGSTAGSSPTVGPVAEARSNIRPPPAPVMPSPNGKPS